MAWACLDNFACWCYSNGVRRIMPVSRTKGLEMRFFLAVAIVLVAIAATFALQNAQPASVNFLKWSFEASLVIVLILTFAAGALTAFLASIPRRVKAARDLSSLKKAQKDKTRQ